MSGYPRMQVSYISGGNYCRRCECYFITPQSLLIRTRIPAEPGNKMIQDPNPDETCGILLNRITH
jgi:hypothetical protein